MAGIASRTSRNANFSALLSNLTYAIFIALAIVSILAIYTGAGISSLLTLVGVFGLAISLSLQDVLKNFVAGVYILLEQPFRIGDRITVKSVEGLVESIEIRTTNIRTDQGIQIIIPNGTVFTEIISNRSAYDRHLGTIRVTLPEDESFEGVTERVCNKLLTFDVKDVVKTPAPAVVLENITGGKTTFRVEFWTRQGALNEVSPRVALALQEILPKADIVLDAVKPAATVG